MSEYCESGGESGRIIKVYGDPMRHQDCGKIIGQPSPMPKERRPVYCAHGRYAAVNNRINECKICGVTFDHEEGPGDKVIGWVEG